MTDQNGPDAIQPLNGAEMAFYQLATQIMTRGFDSSPRGSRSKEICGACFRIPNPRERVIRFEARKTKLEYLMGEFLWYVSGDPNPTSIAKLAPFWDTLRAPNGLVQSNYGSHIFRDTRSPGTSQWHYMINLLKTDPDTRRAVLSIYSWPNCLENPKDVPCTFSIQFFVRENKLLCNVAMRSNDLILGTCNDVFQFTMLQELLLIELRQDPQFENLELGPYVHYAGSLHIYERHFPMVEKILTEPRADPSMSDLKSMTPFGADWDYETWEWPAQAFNEGRFLDYTAGNDFDAFVARFMGAPK